MRGSGLKNPSIQCATNVALQLLRSISIVSNAVKSVMKQPVEPDKGKSRIGDFPPENGGIIAVFVRPFSFEREHSS